jgi:hypothetical protein
MGRDLLLVAHASYHECCATYYGKMADDYLPSVDTASFQVCRRQDPQE